MTPARSLAAFLVSTCALVGGAAASETGAEVFAEACAACHGSDARGGGPKAALLTTPPPDLTTYAERNGGAFDKGYVIRLIDGREGAAAHGGPMPMFGGLLTGPSVVATAADGSPVNTTAPILAVVEWLESIQEK